MPSLYRTDQFMSLNETASSSLSNLYDYNWKVRRKALKKHVKVGGTFSHSRAC